MIYAVLLAAWGWRRHPAQAAERLVTADDRLVLPKD